MSKLCALMVKGITKIAYRKFRRGKKFSKKGGSSDKKGFRKYEGKSAKSDRGDNSNVKCYNCGERGHISPDCYGDDKSEKGTEQIKPIVVKQTAKPKDKPAEVNIGLMTKKQLKQKLKEIRNVNKVKAARKNRNGKEGVNKSNNYMPVPNSPRKKCYKYGNSNHLASFWRKNKNINSLPPKSGVKSQSVRDYHMDFFEKHCEVVSNSTGKVVLKGYRHVNVMSIAKKKYVMVIVDEFTRSDNGTKFKNSIMEEFCKEHGIKQEFSTPGTPQQNGVVERKNRILIEAARTMLDEAKLSTYFWAEAVQTAYFTQNAILIKKHGKTPYEMVKKKKPNLKYSS
ncbi:hypothetical protein AgCh_012818 [Apium graveolens]